MFQWHVLNKKSLFNAAKQIRKLFDTLPLTEKRKPRIGYENIFEQIFQGLLDDVFEPSLEDCRVLMEDFGLNTFIAGETSVSLGRMLYYIKHKLVDALIHVNPVFCCPGVISSSIFRKIQERFNIPIIDLFYDGTNKPNKMIDPHMFYLTKRTG